MPFGKYANIFGDAVKTTEVIKRLEKFWLINLIGRIYTLLN